MTMQTAQNASSQIDDQANQTITSLVEPKIKHGQIHADVVENAGHMHSVFDETEQELERQGDTTVKTPTGPAMPITSLLADEAHIAVAPLAEDTKSTKDTKDTQKTEASIPEGDLNLKISLKNEPKKEISSTQASPVEDLKVNVHDPLKGGVDEKKEARHTTQTMVLWSFYAFILGIVMLGIYYMIFMYDGGDVLSEADSATEIVKAEKVEVASAKPASLTASAPEPAEPAPFPKDVKPVPSPKKKDAPPNETLLPTSFKSTEVGDGLTLFENKELGVSFTAPSGWVQCEAIFFTSEATSLAFYDDIGCPTTEFAEPIMILSLSKETLRSLANASFDYIDIAGKSTFAEYAAEYDVTMTTIHGTPSESYDVITKKLANGDFLRIAVPVEQDPLSIIEILESLTFE